MVIELFETWERETWGFKISPQFFIIFSKKAKIQP